MLNKLFSFAVAFAITSCMAQSMRQSTLISGNSSYNSSYILICSEIGRTLNPGDGWASIEPRVIEVKCQYLMSPLQAEPGQYILETYLPHAISWYSCIPKVVPYVGRVLFELLARYLSQPDWQIPDNELHPRKRCISSSKVHASHPDGCHLSQKYYVPSPLGRSHAMPLSIAT